MKALKIFSEHRGVESTLSANVTPTTPWHGRSSDPGHPTRTPKTRQIENAQNTVSGACTAGSDLGGGKCEQHRGNLI